MNAPWSYDRVPLCSGCGVETVDWRDGSEAWLGKQDAKYGSGCWENLGGWDKDGKRLCETCVEEHPELVGKRLPT